MQKSNDVLKEQSVNISSNRFFLEPFLKIFYKQSTFYYFPSYFLPSNLKVEDTNNLNLLQDTDYFNLLEYIMYNQYAALESRTTCINECISDLNSLLHSIRI
jgi:hypothetical protein